MNWIKLHEFVFPSDGLFETRSPQDFFYRATPIAHAVYRGRGVHYDRGEGLFIYDFEQNKSVLIEIREGEGDKLDITLSGELTFPLRDLLRRYAIEQATARSAGQVSQVLAATVVTQTERLTVTDVPQALLARIPRPAPPGRLIGFALDLDRDGAADWLVADDHHIGFYLIQGASRRIWRLRGPHELCDWYGGAATLVPDGQPPLLAVWGSAGAAGAHSCLDVYSLPRGGEIARVTGEYGTAAYERLQIGEIWRSEPPNNNALQRTSAAEELDARR